MAVTERERMATVEKILRSIDAQQQDHPGYAADVAAALVNSELKRVEAETARGAK